MSLVKFIMNGVKESRLTELDQLSFWEEIKKMTAILSPTTTEKNNDTSV